MASILASAISSVPSSSQNLQAGSRWARIAQRVAISLLCLGVAGYVAIIGLVYFQQEKLIFHPAPLNADHKFTIADVVEVKVPVAGAQLSALHLRLPNPKGVVFFLHGNGGNLQTWLTSVDFYRRVNYDLFMIDYRGFGKSDGRVESEAQLHDDVRKAWNFIAQAYAGKKLVVYGRSLGTGLAAKLSSDIQPDLTVLVSPYESLKAMGDAQYPWLPAFVNRYTMRTDQWLPAIKKPVMIEHGNLDTLIALSHGERLKKIVPATELVVVTGAGHNDIHKFPQYLDTLAERLSNL
jgi:pimeloyl-ACP methyl ester carboxylesterase